jgi:hypothetical protein
MGAFNRRQGYPITKKKSKTEYIKSKNNNGIKKLAVPAPAGIGKGKIPKSINTAYGITKNPAGIIYNQKKLRYSYR